MEVVSLISFVAFLVLLLSTLIGLANAIHRNHLSADVFRHALHEQIKQLRLHKMLQLHQIDQHRFLQTESIRKIEHIIHNCTHCPSKHTCDHTLAHPAHTQTVDFCPNHVDLTNIKKR